MHIGQLLHRLIGSKEDFNRVAVARYRRMVVGGFRDISSVDLHRQIPGGSEFRHDRLTVPSVHV